MTSKNERQFKLAILYEHPEWFGPLFTELDRRGVPYDRLLPEEFQLSRVESSERYSIVLNRMSPSAYLRGRVQAILKTRDLPRQCA